MSEPTAQPGPVSEASKTSAGIPPRSFLSVLGALLVSPRDAMGEIVRNPRPLVPILAATILGLAFVAAWLPRVEIREAMRTADEQSTGFARAAPEQQAAILEGQVRWFPRIAWVSAIIGSPVFIVGVGSILFFIFRFFYAARLTFSQAISVVGHSVLVVSLVQTPLTFLTLWLKGDWAVLPQEALRANLSILLDKAEASHALYSLAGNLDLFTFWRIFLLSLGLGLASGRKTLDASWGVVVPWLLVGGVTVVVASLS